MKKIAIIAAAAFAATALQATAFASSALFNLPSVLSANDYADSTGRTYEDVMQMVDASAEAYKEAEANKPQTPAEPEKPAEPEAPAVVAPTPAPAAPAQIPVPGTAFNKPLVLGGATNADLPTISNSEYEIQYMTVNGKRIPIIAYKN